MRDAVTTARLPKSIAPLSPAVKSNGLMFVSGQPAQSPDGTLFPGGIEAQTGQVFAQLAAILDAAGRGFDDVVRATVYLTDMADYAAMNAIYGGMFASPHPARTTIAVAGLPLGAKIEIELVVAC